MKPIAGLLFAVLATASPSYAPDFRDIAAAAGLTDAFPNGGTKTKQYIIETTGSGVAMIDIDNDGLLDIFVASGAGGRSRLYRNEGNDRFRDVSDQFGITGRDGPRASAPATTTTMASRTVRHILGPEHPLSQRAWHPISRRHRRGWIAAGSRPIQHGLRISGL